MQYIIMLTIVVGLALTDIVTGWIKAHVNDDYSSKVMRKGRLNKVGEVVIMAAFCGLEIGIRYLGQYYDSEVLAAITGGVAVVGVFIYIAVVDYPKLIKESGCNGYAPEPSTNTVRLTIDGTTWEGELHKI